jgi:uncharacterized protein (AIM24 family)
MQKLEGDGLAFLHAGGTVVKRSLENGKWLLPQAKISMKYSKLQSKHRRVKV